MHRAALVTIIALSCKGPSDPERDVREAYVASLVQQVDGGPERLAFVSRAGFVFGEGFHLNEYDARKGKNWRWAAKHAELSFTCPVGARWLRLQGWFAHKPNTPQQTRITANGSLVATVGGDDEFTTSIDLRSLCSSQNAVSMVFQSDYALTFQEDHRDLAIAISHIDWDKDVP